MNLKAKNVTESICPHCEHRLVPVHAVEARLRRVIALSCPEPYCDHILYLPPDESANFRPRAPLPQRSTGQRQVS